jgi:hypothetical protein
MERGGLGVGCERVRRDLCSIYGFMAHLTATCPLLRHSRAQNDEMSREEDGAWSDATVSEAAGTNEATRSEEMVDLCYHPYLLPPWLRRCCN